MVNMMGYKSEKGPAKWLDLGRVTEVTNKLLEGF